METYGWKNEINCTIQCSRSRCKSLIEEHKVNVKIANLNQVLCPKCNFQTHHKTIALNTNIYDVLHKLKHNAYVKYGNRKLLNTIDSQTILFHIYRIKNNNIRIIQKLEEKVAFNEKDAAVLLLQMMSYQYCGDMIVECHFCDGKFSQKQMKNHIHVDHENLRKFICDVCEWKTLLKDKLDSHKQKHTSGRDISCPHCPYLCVEFQQLFEHKKMKHHVYNNICLM